MNTNWSIVGKESEYRNLLRLLQSVDVTAGIQILNDREVLRGSRSAPLLSTAHLSYQYIKPYKLDFSDLNNLLQLSLAP